MKMPYQFCQAQRPLPPATLRNAERETLLERLQHKRAAKFAFSDPTLGSPTTTSTTLSASPEAYDALLLAQLFDHAGSLRFVSEFLDTALEKMTEEEAAEVMLAGDPPRTAPPLATAPVSRCDHQQHPRLSASHPQAEGRGAQVGNHVGNREDSGAAASEGGPMPCDTQPIVDLTILYGGIMTIRGDIIQGGGIIR